MITLVRWLMIATTIALSPFYALWVAGGWIADKREHRRYQRGKS